MQGDIVLKCPILEPLGLSDIESDIIEGNLIKYDTVVMSQSCDLALNKLDLVLLCPIWTLEDAAKSFKYLESDNGKESLRRGYIPGYHLLNKCNSAHFNDSYLVVEFRSVYSVGFKFLNNHIKTLDNRIRILSPYREHLSQAFARFFMRVGLPTDIEPFSKKPDIDIP